jgi:hypothetical protein
VKDLVIFRGPYLCLFIGVSMNIKFWLINVGKSCKNGAQDDIFDDWIERLYSKLKISSTDFYDIKELLRESRRKR